VSRLEAYRVAVLLAFGATATVLAFPPSGLAGLGALMLAPIVAALEGTPPRRAFLVVWVYFVSTALLLVHWLVHALVGQYGVASASAWVFTILVVSSGGVIQAAAVALYAALRRRIPDGAAPLAFSALWVLGEWLRGELLGLPWLFVAHTLVRFPAAVQIADLGGAYAVGFVLVAVNAALGLAARRRSVAPLTAPAVLMVAAALYGAWRLGAEPGAAPEARLAVVQAAVPQEERFQPGSAYRNTERHAELTLRAARSGKLDLVVWSETAVDIDLDENPALRHRLGRLADQVGVPFVTGAPRSEGGVRTNSVVLFTPGSGIAESYAKQRLVPFSEYDPRWAGPLARLLGPVVAGQPYVPGPEPTVFHHGPIPFAAPVCFEVTYPGLMRRFRDAGAELVLNLSNDAWFGRSGYLEMHFAHAILRAVELRIWVVRGANTGISGFVDPTGRVVTELPVFEEGVILSEVRAAGGMPFYARAGDLPVVAFLVAVAAGPWLGARFRGRWRRPAGRSGSPAPGRSRTGSPEDGEPPESRPGRPG
jgi:apolipoprotein N-acyltransferase